MLGGLDNSGSLLLMEEILQGSVSPLFETCFYKCKLVTAGFPKN